MENPNIKEVGENQKEITIKIEKAPFDEAILKAYRRNVGKISVPGFRKGKAPKSIIEKMYGSAFFYDEAIDNLFPVYYTKVVEDAGLKVVSRPEVDIVSVGEEGVTLTAKVYIKPTAAVAKYKGLAAEKAEVTVSEEEIENEILQFRKRNSRLLTVSDRAAENGDDVLIDFEGFIGGVAFENGAAEKQKLRLGSGSFIPGFEEKIIGHTPGETFEIGVTFPEEYGAEDLAGKDATFKIVLHEIKKEEIPELDDDFVKEVSETLNTVDEYKADIKAKITERKTKANDIAVEEKLMDALLASTSVEIPEPMVETELETELRDFDYRLRAQNGSLDMYYKYTGTGEKELMESFRPQAERRIKVRLALEAVAEAEGIAAAPEEIEAEYQKIADGYNRNVEEIKETLHDADIAQDICLRKAAKLIAENAVLTKPEQES